MSDAVALHSMRLTARFLPVCVEDGRNIEARGQQLIAACMAAIAFNNAVLGLTHAMAHALGAKFHLHHGTANALLLPHVMRYNRDAAPERMAIVAETLGVDTASMSMEEAGLAAADAVSELTKRFDLPQRLRDVEVDPEVFEALAQLALADACLITNPKPVFDPAEIVTLYQRAW